MLKAEMTRLVKSDWMGLRRILPELLQATEQFHEAEPLLRQVGLMMGFVHRVSQRNKKSNKTS